MKKSSQPLKQKTLVGNIANQKYEASRNIERHIDIVYNTQPTHETTRWRTTQPYYFMKQEGRLVVEEKLRNKDNQLFNHRLQQLATERREPDAREHAPGWRTGKGGVFIDCYSPSNRETVLEGMKKKQDFARYTFNQKRDKENVLILKFLESARSSYDREELRKKYDRNRVAYNLFSSKTPRTALHLGLVKTAKERIDRRNRMAAHHYSAISAGTSTKSRPKSAPNVNKYDRQVLKAVDKIHDIHDFYDLKEIDRQLRNRTGGWDSSTKDVHGSHATPTRAATIYSSHKSAPYKSVDYLGFAQSITEVMEEQTRRQQALDEREEEARKAAAKAVHRVDLLDLPPELLHARPKTADASSLPRGQLMPPLAPHGDGGSPDGLRAEAKAARGGQTEALHRLGMLRKNVSFQDGSGQPSSSSASGGGGGGGGGGGPERRRSFLRQGSGSGRLHSTSWDSEDKAVASLARSTSVVSDLDTDDDPTLPTASGRRKSLLLDVHFEEDSETGRPRACHPATALHGHDDDDNDDNDGDGGGGGGGGARAAEAVLQRLGLQLASRFHLPVRCRPLDAPQRRALSSAEGGPLAAVHLSLFDVGYFLPGNDDGLAALAAGLSPSGPETSEAPASVPATGSAHRLSALIGRSASTDDRVKRSPLGGPSPSASSPGLRQVRGLSLPTSVGLLVVASDAAATSDVAPAFVYLSVHQVLASSLCSYADCLPRAVFGEMLAFAYPFGAEGLPTTPRDANRFRLASDQARGSLCVDADSPRAMVLPCLADMMDPDVLRGFVDIVTSRLDVRWDDDRKQLVLRCP